MQEIELSDAQKSLVQQVTGLVNAAKESVHNKFVGRCEQWDNYYHSWRSMKDEVRGLDRPDRDIFWQEQKSTWGSDLKVPYAFSVVETMLPRMLANNPRMLTLPRERVAEQNIENMKFIIDAQQEQMNYPMSLQTSGKDGLLYGLAISKLYWRTEERIARADEDEHLDIAAVRLELGDPVDELAFQRLRRDIGGLAEFAELVPENFLVVLHARDRGVD